MQQPESFSCSQCGKQFKRRADIAGQTIRCVCGAKVRCPSPSDDTSTAAESLEDTVADVPLEEIFDQIETEVEADAPGIESAGEVISSPRGTRGPFGLGPAGETLLWGIGFLIGLSFIILAIIVRFWFYGIAAAVCSWTAWKFYRSWTKWTRGRPWLECLAEAFGENDDSKANA